jgi:hypothetical protein
LVTGRAVFPVALHIPFSVSGDSKIKQKGEDEPDEKTVRELDELLVLILSDNDLVLDLLDHSLGANVNLVLLESVVGVLAAKCEWSAVSGDGKRQRTNMSCLENMGRTLGRASMRVILILPAISGYHFHRASEISLGARSVGLER